MPCLSLLPSRPPSSLRQPPPSSPDAFLVLLIDLFISVLSIPASTLFSPATLFPALIFISAYFHKSASRSSPTLGQCPSRDPRFCPRLNSPNRAFTSPSHVSRLLPLSKHDPAVDSGLRGMPLSSLFTCTLVAAALGRARFSFVPKPQDSLSDFLVSPLLLKLYCLRFKVTTCIPMPKSWSRFLLRLCPHHRSRSDLHNRPHNEAPLKPVLSLFSIRFPPSLAVIIFVHHSGRSTIFVTLKVLLLLALAFDAAHNSGRYLTSLPLALPTFH